MGLLNTVATGYQRGQAQYAANEKKRKKDAADLLKAQQDAAEFSLKLATHSQTLTNSAEAEWNAIMAEVTSDNWDPAKLPMLLPRAANFDKTYGNVWGGGSAVKNLQEALHLNSPSAATRKTVIPILEANKDKDFVRRILNPETAPASIKNQDGTVSSHLMAWGEADGKFIVYPTIMNDNGTLKNYGDAAASEAIKRGEYITFNSAKEAEDFSRNYKSVWDSDSLTGFLSPEQKFAADEKARKARTAEAARDFTIQAMDYIRTPGGGLPDEAVFYRKVYDFQDQAIRSGEWDMETLDKAMDMIRENAAGYYKGLADELDKATKQTALSDAINSRVAEVGKQASAWITSILQMDASGNMISEDAFASRTPLRLKMEQYAQNMAELGMPLGQIKNRIAGRFSDELGGLELDIRKTPGMGALTFAGAPLEARNAVDRYFDLNMSPNEHRLETYWNPQTNEAWVVDPVSPQDSQRVWPPANQGTMPQGVAGTGKPTGGAVPVAAPSAANSETPAGALPIGRAVLPGQVGKISERAALERQNAEMTATYNESKAKIDSAAEARRKEGEAKVAMRFGGRSWAMQNINDSMDPATVERAIVGHMEEILRSSGMQSLATGGFSQQAQRLYDSVKDKVAPGDTYQETAARIFEAAFGKGKK